MKIGTADDYKTSRKWAEYKRRTVGPADRVLFRGQGGMQINLWHVRNTQHDANVSRS